MRPERFAILLLLLAGGCASPSSSGTLSTRPPVADALITHQVILTAHGRDFPLIGYLSISSTGGKRLLLTQGLGQTIGDVLVKPDGKVYVMGSGPMLKATWLERYAAADLLCIYGGAPPAADCPGRAISTNHWKIERRWYSIDIQEVDFKPGPQPANLFEIPHPKEK